MYIHPLEAIGYYCILYSPIFVYRNHLFSFLAYMGIAGILGVLDHSGIQVRWSVEIPMPHLLCEFIDDMVEIGFLEFRGLPSPGHYNKFMAAEFPDEVSISVSQTRRVKRFFAKQVRNLCTLSKYTSWTTRNVCIYDTMDHDVHHELFDCNYGFPTMILDYFHGTYWNVRANKHVKVQ